MKRNGRKNQKKAFRSPLLMTYNQQLGFNNFFTNVSTIFISKLYFLNAFFVGGQFTKKKC